MAVEFNKAKFNRRWHGKEALRSEVHLQPITMRRELAALV